MSSTLSPSLESRQRHPYRSLLAAVLLQSYQDAVQAAAQDLSATTSRPRRRPDGSRDNTADGRTVADRHAACC